MNHSVRLTTRHVGAFLRHHSVAMGKRNLSSSANPPYGSTLRNILIAAHIDAGKTSIVDQILRRTGAVSDAQLAENPLFLDGLSVEKERGITVQLRAARMRWSSHIIQLVDSPGHVDFATQVSQSLGAADAVILVIDATRGVQAQTLAHLELAIKHSKSILPVINKIDLPTADVDACLDQLIDLPGIAYDPVLTSAKTGVGIPELLDTIVAHVPPAATVAEASAPLRAIIIDSFYCSYRGVIALIRLRDGSMCPGDKLRMLSAPATSPHLTVDSVGFLEPQEVPCEKLRAGDVGFVATGVKELGELPVGGTLVGTGPDAATEAIGTFVESAPVVWMGIFPSDPADFANLRKALQKLKLTDTSLAFEVDQSAAMGTGFRCGFSGLLHADVVSQRLLDDFELDLITSAPSVSYHVREHEGGEWVVVANPSLVPDGAKIKEPIADVEILAREQDVGAMIKLAGGRRGEIVDQTYVGNNRVRLSYKIPLSECIADFHDKIKELSSGYCTMGFNVAEFRESPLARMDFRVAGEKIDELSMIVDRDSSTKRARAVVLKLKENIPRHSFKVAIQALIGGKIVASEHIQPYRKDVTGGKISGLDRKKKLLEKQKKGKKRMKTFGKVDVPQAAFLSVNSRD